MKDQKNIDNALPGSAQAPAAYDALTDLPNRAMVLREGQRLLAEFQRAATHLSLLLIGLDGLSSVGITLTDPLSDVAIQQVVGCLKNSFRDMDFLGRAGDRVFVALVRHEDPRHITAIAARIAHMLNEPFSGMGQNIPGGAVRARLGVATYPQNGADIQALLAHAQAAMRHAQNAGDGQPGLQGSDSSQGLDEGTGQVLTNIEPNAAGREPASKRSALYGGSVSRSLASLTATLRPHMDAIVDDFYGRLSQMPGAQDIINSLSQDELSHLKGKQKDNILMLCSPVLTEREHEATALRLGRMHAMTGLDRAILADSHETLQSIILDYVDASWHSRALSILYRRLLKELAWQLHAVQDLQQSHQRILQEINALSWNARSYLDLITQATDVLALSEGILGCVLMRPDDSGLLMLEALAGNAVHDVFESVQAQQKTWLWAGEDPTKPGPTHRAWHTRQIERCLNYATDASVAHWAPLIRGTAIRSSVTLPLVISQDRDPIALLALYAKFPGGFSSREQKAFLVQVQSLLVFGINRLESWSGVTHTVPYFVRRRWHALLEDTGLEMHYQPIVELKTNRTTKVEALARLRDGSRLLTPAQFFPALSMEDFFHLYVRGLNQALRQRVQWRAQGLELDIAVNLPAAGLTDARYVQATREALKTHACPPAALTLEVLETEELAPNVDLIEALGHYLNLGVMLAEDDLGSGYSSLSRLREIPFQIVKIDRSLIHQVRQDAFNALRFVYQLTRLGHNLGKKVVVEGVEDEGMLRAIALLDTDYVQGYVVARPMPADALPDWLASSRSPLPVCSDNVRADNPMVKLACLLTWEEELHLLLEGTCPPLPTDDARLCDMRNLIMSMPISDSGAVQAKNQLFANALDDGLRSMAYVQAREELIIMIFNACPDRPPV
ncbi:EAL domain-containing protein [Bordetella sp. FB-8]|uniref:bifunctional diguanylate cyclase/phosphodiesterase n=1 Tax=Bordetella sp. FB-8 TaxID=1159870 RepID=UPI000380904F|nr:EAL domain-containing protein [Bordetella sp. FB-8]